MPDQHPIEELMKTAMESIKEIVDVSTVVGDPVETKDGMMILPISKVACGFVAGGGEFEMGAEKDGGGEATMPAFGGGSGAGVSVKPIGFLVVGNGQVRLLPVDGNAVVDRIVDAAPQLLNQLQSMFGRKHENQPVAKIEVTTPPPAPVRPVQ